MRSLAPSHRLAAFSLALAAPRSARTPTISEFVLRSMHAAQAGIVRVRVRGNALDGITSVALALGVGRRGR